MQETEFVNWPYRIFKPEADWSDHERDWIEFMRVAYAEGFRPRHQSESAVEAGDAEGRLAFLVFRGARNGWEPWLSDGNRCERLGRYYDLPLEDSACVCVRPPFRAAAHLALEWLRGRELPELLNDFEFVGGHPSGIVLRSEAGR